MTFDRARGEAGLAMTGFAIMAGLWIKGDKEARLAMGSWLAKGSRLARDTGLASR